MSEQDPLKRIFQFLPEVEPPATLKYRVMNRGMSREFWFLKPAVAIASMLFLAFLGAKMTTRFVPERIARKESSAVLKWAKQEESSFPKISKDNPNVSSWNKGGFLS